LPADASIDVIVTDRMIACDDLPHSNLGSRLAAGEIAVVRIGPGPGDVSLPDDCTPRELRLACRLLAEIVRLRRDRSRARRLQRALAELARSDPLTGLPNRRAWEDELVSRVQTGEMETDGYCLALLDLDHFKSVNDRFGHAAGDDVLRHVARKLDAQIDGSDFVARLGGDEFVLLMTARDVTQAATLVERLRTTVCDGSPHTTITASAGYAFSTELRSETIDGLFHAADDALRSAKSSGRDRSVNATTAGQVRLEEK
jgi:diguanylate cyclase (GGDEF)-like protein